ncbi:MAG: type I 3-dehydroquinate dehydratase [Bifidobacteriaceae bacterium]|jgi:3-dehydroquinate dehydratase-1|nr:type I 3-dehydroquinate dehydratase [Bifidobacteriaceae bacterium]
MNPDKKAWFRIGKPKVIPSAILINGSDNLREKRVNVFKQGEPKIVVPIVEKTDSEILNRALQIAETRADMIELRADYYEYGTDSKKVITLLKKLWGTVPNLPIIFTFRTKDEGGKAEISASEYLDLCDDVAQSNIVAAVDVEYDYIMADFNNFLIFGDLFHSSRSAIIVSKHILDPAHFADSYEKVADILLDLKLDVPADKHSDIVKLAFMANDNFDFEALNAVVRKVKDEIGLYAVIAMGENGVESRTRACELGSCITFMSFGKESAAGQAGI